MRISPGDCSHSRENLNVDLMTFSAKPFDYGYSGLDVTCSNP